MGPGFRRDDNKYSRGVISPEFCKFVAPSLIEGAGKAGR